MLIPAQRRYARFVPGERAECLRERHVTQALVQRASVPGSPNVSSSRAAQSRDGARCADSTIATSDGLKCNRAARSSRDREE
jgi:hypothetical protein